MTHHLNATQRQQLREELRRQQQELERELDGQLGAQSRVEHAREALLQDGDGNSQREVALDASREVDLARSDQTLQTLRALSAALAALDHEDFGHCVDCGEAIAFARLQASPASQRCLHCQTRREAATRPHLH